VATPQQEAKEYMLRSSHVVQADIYVHQTMERWLGAPSYCDGYLSHLPIENLFLEKQTSKEGGRVITFALTWIQRSVYVSGVGHAHCPAHQRAQKRAQLISVWQKT
jgi:hypothetical protein